MEIKTTFDGGLKVSSHCNGHVITSDQSIATGGEASAPDPFILFLSSIANCAGYFALKFCQTRDIPADGVEVTLSNDFNKELKRAENIKITLKLPESFPQKYRKALLKSVDQCTVKKTILFGPKIDLNIEQ